MIAKDRLRMLLVEDSILTAEQICELIRTHHPEVTCTTVSTEREALDNVTESMPDILVLDLRLKEGSGFNVLRNVSTKNPKPQTVVLTNYALPQYREYAMLSGADYFLDKSTSMEALPTILDTLFEQRSPPV
jgi:two-component system, OmpR family, response regulator